MECEYKRENHKSFMVVKQNQGMEESFSLAMILENKLACLLPVAVHSFNGENEIYYDISGKQSLACLYEKKEINSEELRDILRSLQTGLMELEEYMLGEDDILLSPEFLYYDLVNKRVALTFFHESEAEYLEKKEAFVDFILDRVCHEEEEAVVTAYSFYRYMKEEAFDMVCALGRLFEEKEEAETGRDKQISQEKADILNESAVDEVHASVKDDFYLDSTDFSEQASTVDQENSKREKNLHTLRTVFFAVLLFGGIGMTVYGLFLAGFMLQLCIYEKETVVGGGIIVLSLVGLFLNRYIYRKRTQNTRETFETVSKEGEFGLEEELFQSKQDEPVFLGDRAEEQPVEVSRNTYETVLIEENCYREERILTGKIRGKRKEIDLSRFPFIIGKMQGKVDFVMEDSSISRMHARFTLREDAVYLTDLNSLNGTYHNGIRLEPNEQVLLESGDEIVFGRLRFTYH